MKKIKDFKKWWKKNWNANINISPRERETPNMMVFLIVFIFATLFFIFAAFGGGILYLMALVLNEIYPNFQMNEISWMFIGLVFGIASMFFVQAFPSKTGRDETPAKIWKSFMHHFSYFVVFFLTIIWWGIILFIILLPILE